MAVVKSWISSTTLRIVIVMAFSIVGVITTFQVSRHMQDNQFKQRALAVAESVASIPEVSQLAANGDPQGVSPDMAKAIAEKLGFRATMDDRYKILEMSVMLDLPGFEHKKNGEPTGLMLPYIVTIEKSTSTVLAIRRNWRERSMREIKFRAKVINNKQLEKYWFYGYPTEVMHVNGNKWYMEDVSNSK